VAQGSAVFAATNSIDSGTSCGFGGANGNQSMTDPMLGMLQSNGGATETHALALTSPAIGAASPDCGSPPAMAADVATDQRGWIRPQGALCDVGAYEFPYQRLTVQRSGTGAGTVTGSGVNCGMDCDEDHPEGSQTTLTATADPSSTFAGWTGCDMVAGNQCTVTVQRETTVTASFTALPPTASVPSLTPTAPLPSAPPVPPAPAKKCKKKKRGGGAAARKRCKKRKR